MPPPARPPPNPAMWDLPALATGTVKRRPFLGPFSVQKLMPLQNQKCQIPVFKKRYSSCGNTVKSSCDAKISDCDSGIENSPLSPVSHQGLLQDFEWCRNLNDPRETAILQRIQIYTDWANHYLEKGRSKKRVNFLTTDCCDGVLLAEVIESVINQKIPDINRKPKTGSQMLDNINLCLGVLQAQHVGGLDAVSAQELRDGKLKAILALFFALSKHKQATKQQQRAAQQQNLIAIEMTPNRTSSGGVVYKGGSSIPLPGSVLPVRKSCNQQSANFHPANPAQSLIPRGPATGVVQQQNGPQKTSMLEKFRFFKTTTNCTTSGSNCTNNGKRTSSSSGVSSAKSERSDSSTSLIVEPLNTKNVVVPQTKTKSTSLAKTNSTTTKHKSSSLPKQKIILVSRQTSTDSGLVVPQNRFAPAPQNPAVGTGIPKPTAAIKGTTKPMILIKDDGPNPKLKLTLEAANKIGIPECNKFSRKQDFIKDSPPPQLIQNEDETSDLIVVQPMKPLMRNYCSTYNLTNGTTTHHHHHRIQRNYPKVQVDGGSDYCEISLANGYLSDGDILQQQDFHSGFSDPGYMSEGGGGGGTILSYPIAANRSRNAQVVPTGNQNQQQSLTVLSEQSTPRGRLVEETAPSPPNGRHRQRYVENSTTPPTSVPKHHSGGGHHHWKRYTDSPGVGSPPPPLTAPKPSRQPPPPPAPGAPSSPTNSANRQKRNNSPHHHATKEKPSPVVPKGQNFGYVKKIMPPDNVGAVPNGAVPTVQNTSVPPIHQLGKTASVPGVPRTKVKVSGGTQTCSSDLQQINHKGNSIQQYKSYSLTVNAANQLSQSVRERLLLGSQSLPKSAGQECALILRHQARQKASDGSLSDTQAADGHHHYAPWLRHSNTYSIAPKLSETDSLESLTSLPSHRSSLSHASRLLRDSPARLSRSNSIRSTKSEKLYHPSMMHRNVVGAVAGNPGPAGSAGSTAENDTEPYYCLPVNAQMNHSHHHHHHHHWSQPTSPAPGSARTFLPLSPTHSTATSSGGPLRHGSVGKNDDVHGSSISLVSTASSLYSSAEEKHAHEIRKLRRELSEAQEKVQTLTTQLTTNAHVVSAFEQSLSSMTQRLQHLTATAEKKDSELSELRNAMELLRAQSLQAGLVLGNTSLTNVSPSSGLARQASSDSVSSLSSACSLDKHEKKKKKGWLRSSFTKAFSRNNNNNNNHNSTNTSTKLVNNNNSKMLLGDNESSELNHDSPSADHPEDLIPNGGTSFVDPNEEVVELQKQLREKDLVLTDIRLEALSSAHQLENLKDTVMKMRSEMLSLKQNNERLQKMVSGTVNLPAELPSGSSSTSIDVLSDLITAEEHFQSVDQEPDGKRVTISIYLGQPQCFSSYYSEHYGDESEEEICRNGPQMEVSVAHTNIGASTTWLQLDHVIRRAFKQHVARLDPGGGLGLGSDAIASYKLGEVDRKPSNSVPPDLLLPVGYAIGRVSTIHVVLQPVAALAFEALIPKGVAQRLVSLLAEHRRLVLCGAPGTGKTHLAMRLAEFHARAQGRDPAEAVVTFSVDPQCGKELRQYLTQLSERAASNDNGLPSVVVLDNLHKVGTLADALGSLPRNLPCLLGTMAQSACSATSLQLQHGFRWVLVAPHMEPARGLLGRVLRRRLASLELDRGPQPTLAAILGWLPRIWQHINAFLETHSSGDVAIGPRLFLSCPLDLDAARAWFTDLWNYSLAPYLREAAREGVQLYGRRAPWADPAQFIVETYPWPGSGPQGLTTISAKDVGLTGDGPMPANVVNTKRPEAENGNDPLLSMLIQLQEAASYNSGSNSPANSNNNLVAVDSGRLIEANGVIPGQLKTANNDTNTKMMMMMSNSCDAKNSI